jgi:hypothetical protein
MFVRIRSRGFCGLSVEIMRQARLRDKAPGYRPIIAYVLAEPVRALLDPQGRGRQHIAARLVQLTGTRAGGFVLASTSDRSASDRRRAPR